MTRELAYRGLEKCDGCGVVIPKARQLAGLCESCQLRAQQKQGRRSWNKASRRRKT